MLFKTQVHEPGLNDDDNIYDGNVNKVPFITESIHIDVQNAVWPIPESSWGADTLSFIGDCCQFAATDWWSRQEIKIED